MDMLNQQIHNYKIISLLGEGGMANVYLVEHLTLGQNYALKLLKDEFVQHPNIRKRRIALVHGALAEDLRQVTPLRRIQLVNRTNDDQGNKDLIKIIKYVFPLVKQN